MPDTARTLAAVKAIINDNTSGDISPQDVRDMLQSIATPILDGPGPWVDVRGYGAVGDGVTDDATAFQAAITAAAGKTLYIPPGVYVIGTELTVATVTRIVGAGITKADGTGLIDTNGTILKAKTASAIRSILRLSAAYCDLQGFSLDGNSTATNCILFHNSERTMLTHIVATKGASYGFRWDISAGSPTGNNNGMKLYGCIATGNVGTGYGIPAYQSDNNAIDFFGCTATVNGAHGFWLCGQQGVYGGHVESNTSYGYKLGNSADGSFTVGVRLLYPHIEGNTAGGILADKTADCTYFKTDPGAQGINFAGSATPDGIAEFSYSSGTQKVTSGSESRSVELVPAQAQVKLSGFSATDRDLQLAPKGAGLVWGVNGFLVNNLAQIKSGTGSPAGVVSAPVGSLWLRSDGGASTSLYVKESGTGTSGWVAK